jgi:hypothetical protein
VDHLQRLLPELKNAIAAEKEKTPDPIFNSTETEDTEGLGGSAVESGIVHYFFDIIKRRSGFKLGVHWSTGDETYEPLGHVVHCDQAILLLDRWVNADCPKKRLHTLFEIGARDDWDANKMCTPVVDNFPFTYQAPESDTCFQDTMHNALARLDLNTDKRDVPRMTNRRHFTDFWRNKSSPVTMQRVCLTKHTDSFQALESGHLYIGIAKTESVGYHACVIDCLHTTNVLVDSTNKCGPVLYDKASVQWVVAWCKIYRVKKKQIYKRKRKYNNALSYVKRTKI